MSERTVYASPKGEALYPYVDRPDNRFDPEGVFRVDLVVDPAVKEHKDFLNFLYKHTPKPGKPPYKKHIDPETGEETPFFVVHFKSKFKPKVFDAKGNLIEGESNLGMGSKIKVSYSMNEYTGFGGGLNLYLRAIQIIELIPYSGPKLENYGLEPEEGFEYHSGFDAQTAQQAEALRDKIQNKSDLEPEDDLPF